MKYYAIRNREIGKYLVSLGPAYFSKDLKKVGWLNSLFTFTSTKSLMEYILREASGSWSLKCDVVEVFPDLDYQKKKLEEHLQSLEKQSLTWPGTNHLYLQAEEIYNKYFPA